MSDPTSKWVPLTVDSEDVARLMSNEEVAMRVKSASEIPTMTVIVEKLVENSLGADVGTTIIEVHVDATRGLVSVSDNGVGISDGDLKHIGRHGVRKVDQDSFGLSLYMLSFLGQVEIMTKYKAIHHRPRTLVKRLENGETISLGPVDVERKCFGTTVTIRDVFKRLPVRQAQLIKSAGTVLEEIKTWLTRIALATPWVNLSMQNANGEVLFNYTRTKTAKEAMHQLLGKLVDVNDFIDVNISKTLENGKLVEVAAMFSRNLVFSTKHLQFIYYNDKPLLKGDLVQNIETHVTNEYRKSFSDMSPKHKFPSFVISIHHSVGEKMISWTSFLPHLNELLLQNVLPASHKADTKTPLKQYPPKTKQSPPKVEPSDSDKDLDPWKQFNIKTHRRVFDIKSRWRRKPKLVQTTTALSREELSNAQVIGQMGNKFIAVKCGSKLFCVDQHAAHERIRLESFEDTVISFERSDDIILTSQAYPSAIHVALLPDEVMALKNRDKVNHLRRWKFRFHLDEASSNAILTHGPRLFGTVQLDGVESFRHCLHHVLADQQSIPSVIRDILISKACKGAIKFGDTLSLRECEDLVQQLATCRFPFNCAHGRPTSVPLLEIKNSDER